MNQQIGFNKEKLRRLVRSKNDLHASYLSITGEIDFIRRQQLPNLEQMIKEADEHTELAINREVFDARNEGREPNTIKSFTEYNSDEMLAVYPTHPIRDHLSLSSLQKYVGYRQELESLIEHQREISVKMTPLVSLIARCKKFLEQQGITDADVGIDLG
ncbi:MAG: hypothetical protein IBX56_18485 [Methylomicrobium sp.]|nr:hypothetical protein [Methylomicrobium sp.]